MNNSPNTVLSTAIYMGLVALTRLARNRTSKKTRRYYNSIEKMWKKARAAYENQNHRYPDLSPVQNAEPNMRGRFLKFVWSSTRRFGNREFNRVYSWLEGSVGPLNSLLNYAGARLRDLAMTLYSFPKPQKFEVREYADGSKKIFTVKEAKKNKNDGAIKTYYKFGYERKRKLPRVYLSHPTLSGLDFVDMIRAHCVELCRQCFLYDVPLFEAHRYIRLLIHQLKPFLDWVYSGGINGRNNFNPNADQELRKIVLEIRSLYRKRSKTRKRVSQRNEGTLEPTIELVREKVEAELETATKPDEQKALQKILDHIDTEDIVVRDIEKLVDLVQALGRREGNEWHRVLLSDLHHPVSLKQVVFFGDKMLDEPSSVLIVAELPVAKHAGKIDLTVFIRREVSGRFLWTPIMVLEVKTKTGFAFNLFGMKIKRKREQTITPAFYAWKCTLSEEEWHSIATSGPDQSALDQLEEYKYELLAEYKQIAPHDPNPPSSLWKGVIVLDTDQNPSDVFPAFQFLLEDLTTGLIHQLIGKDTISVTPESLDSGHLDPRVSLLIAPTSGPIELLNNMVPATTIPEENPFAEREPDDRTLTLYVPIDSPTSSGKTAAKLSTNWHLLHHIQECITTSLDPTEIIWLDLMGDYGSKELVEKRFGVGRLFQETKISEDTYHQLSNTLRDIKFINLSTFISRIFNNKAKALDRLFQHLQFLIPSEVKRKRIVVLDGWTELKEMIPKHLQSILRALEIQFLETLPHSDIDIIWIDSGTHHTRMNRFYQRKCITPLRHDSPRRTHLDEVIYNVPTSPWVFGWTTPQREDVRIIIQDVPAKVEPWKVAIHVPQLFGFAEKFRGMSKRKRTYSYEEVERYTSVVLVMHGKNVSLSSIYSPTGRLPEGSFTEVMDDSLTLIPSILRDRGIEPEEEEELEGPEEEVPAAAKWKLVVKKATSRYGPSLKRRMHLAVTRPPPVPVRGKPRYTVAKAITRPWHYNRTPVQFYEDLDEQYVSTAPPVVKNMLGGLIDTSETRELELRRLKYATKYLKDQTFVPQDLRNRCERIERFCVKQFALLREQPSLRTPEFFLESLKEVKRLIMEDLIIAEVWHHLVPIRMKLVDLLNSDNREIIEEISRKTRDLLLLYGNNLFLAVLVALGNNDLAISERLWNSIAEWTFYQLGMDTFDEEVKSVYSFQAIISNLITRANVLSQVNLPETTTLQEQVGAIIWEQSGYKYDALLLIPHEDEYIIAPLRGLMNKMISPKWYKCKTDPQYMKTAANEALTAPDMSPIISTTVLDSQVLWFPLMTVDQELVWASYSLEHAKPTGRHNVVSWIEMEETVPFVVPSSLPSIPDSVDKVLRKLARVKQKHVPVKLILGGDHELEVFKVNLVGKDIDEYLEFTRTNDLVYFLRYNIRLASGYVLDGKTLTWKLEDIEYDELIFIKPLVHRSRFHPDVFHYPKTCIEYLASTKGKEIIMNLHLEGSQYRVELEDLPHGSLLKDLEGVTFDIFALGLLTECEELYDPQCGVWYPVKIDATQIMHMSFSKRHEYPRFKDATDTADVSKFDWTKETWIFSGDLHKNEVNWTILSKTRGYQWRNQSFTLVVSEESPPEETMDALRKAISSIIPLDQLEGIGDELETIESTLQHRHQEFLKKKEEVVSSEYDDITFSFTEASIDGSKVLVSLKSDEGNEEDVYVVQDVPQYIDDTQYAGAVSPERVETEVRERVALYGIEEAELEVIIKEVKEVLEERGVRFHESS